jgi:sugar lactone lactonase YvrE
MKNIILIGLCLFLNGMLCAQLTGFIFTAAGNGITGYSGDDSLAFNAEFSFPDAVVFDPAGNFYISDRDNHVIRKVDTNRIITTFAGNGFPGYQGDNGLAINAEFAAVYSLAMDKAGNLYIADEAVRKIDMSTGIITSIAGNGSNNPGDGGPATQAVTENINQIAFDAAGNLYITDGRHFSIRKVDTAGIISTVAGNGTQGCNGDGGFATAAELNMPEGVAVDTGGNIFIADFQNHNIRRVDATTHLISTICGDPFGNAAGFTGDGGPARLAELMSPNGLVFDSKGNLFICDQQNQAIREITTGGQIFTVVGEDPQNQDPPTDFDGVLATAVRLFNPMGIAFDRDGNLYIAEASRAKVRKVAFGTTGVLSATGEITLKAYPNPVNDLFFVESASLSQGNFSLFVHDITGQIITVPNTLLSGKLQLYTGGLAPGVYLVNVVSDNGSGIVRFVRE